MRDVGRARGFFDEYGLKPKVRTTEIGADRIYGFEFVKILGLTIIAGRICHHNTLRYPIAVLLTYAAASLGFTRGIGKWIEILPGHCPRRIFGVVEDFNYTSFKTNVER